MSDYAGVTPIPDYLNISDWYELVEGDTIPNGWLTIELYPNGNTNIVQEASGYQPVRAVRSALKVGYRLFTRTPTPSAIKRIRTAETQQEELPTQLHPELQAQQDELPTQLHPELQALRDKLVGHTDPEAMSWKISAIELSLQRLNERLSALIDGL